MRLPSYRAYIYLDRRGKRRLVRLGSTLLRGRRSGRLRGWLTVRLPNGNYLYRLAMCVPAPRDDGFGVPQRSERICGRRLMIKPRAG